VKYSLPALSKGSKGKECLFIEIHSKRENLYIKFNVEFPENQFISELKLKQLEAIIPERNEPMEIDLNDEHTEEVDLHEFDPSNDRCNGAGRSEAYDSDDEDSRRGPGGIQCASH